MVAQRRLDPVSAFRFVISAFPLDFMCEAPFRGFCVFIPFTTRLSPRNPAKNIPLPATDSIIHAESLYKGNLHSFSEAASQFSHHRLQFTETISQRRGRWFSLSPGERAGVRASLLLTPGNIHLEFP